MKRVLTLTINLRDDGRTDTMLEVPALGAEGKQYRTPRVSPEPEDLRLTCAAVAYALGGVAGQLEQLRVEGKL